VYKSAIGVVRTGDYDVGNMIFCLNAAANSTVVSASDERMRITSAGNVGIGTSSVLCRLDINNTYVSDTTSQVIIRDDTGGGLLMGGTSGAARWLQAQDYTGAATYYNLLLNPRGGNVGIGTSSPVQILDVRKATASGDTQFNFLNSQNSSAGNTSVTSTIYLGFYDDSNGLANANKIVSGKSGDYTSAPNASSFLAFHTTNANTIAERMRITSAGYVGIGVTPTEFFDVNGIARFRDKIYLADGTSSAPSLRFFNSNSGLFLPVSDTIGFSAGNAERMRISSNGSIGAPSGTNIYNASDIRLKQNVSTTTYGLNTISLLNPVKFNWVDGFEPTEDGKDMLGFVAQEVQEVLPEAIESFGGDINLNGTTITNPLRVNEKFIIPVLVKAIQEQQAQIEELKTLLNA
jgi:hypothetical protein